MHPTVLLFGAVHDVVLRNPDDVLAAFFPSVVGDAARPPDDAGPAFRAFCATHVDELGELVRTRMVQTNVVRRAVALRFGLTHVPFDAVHLVEVGSSAGILLRHDRYRLRLDDEAVGPEDATVDVRAEWRGDGPAPALTSGPTLTDVVGVDLHPRDPTSDDDRRWLRALVWPEDLERAAQLTAALDVVAADPPRLVAGDIRDLADGLDAELPADEPRVVFHAATRGHLPGDEHPSFDDAVRRLGTSGPLAVLAMETAHRDEPRSDSSDPHFLLQIDGRPLAFVEAHGAWIEPVTPGS